MYFESNSNSIKYRTPIPGEVVTGTSIEIVFVPQEPWNQIVFNIYDASETDIVLHISFRKDFNKIQLNSEVQGKFMQNKNAEGVAITSGSVAKLTVEVHQDAFKVFVDGKEKYHYSAVLSPDLSRIIHFSSSLGSNCLLEKICFKDL
ncbi:uncharacterized protein LOC132715920 [Ruditapes philippinarum]|uniref:uncharacterized protein LOC132715920 n=1 Tax=Ruditapes philippinarum TaxID=129788 RepID=UPI00295AC211|nr:uncharacterized protein LOC132715920 [Ruditapes philippinarum]